MQTLIGSAIATVLAVVAGAGGIALAVTSAHDARPVTQLQVARTLRGPALERPDVGPVVYGWRRVRSEHEPSAQ